MYFTDRCKILSKKEMDKKVSRRDRIKRFLYTASSHGNRIHVIPSRSVWLVKKEGLKKSSAVRPTREDAIRVAKNLNSSIGSIIIHGKDGSVQKKILI